MSDHIEVSEGYCGSGDDLIISPAVAEGWLCFTSSTLGQGGPDWWMAVWCSDPVGVQTDYCRCPPPLHRSRDAAIEAAKKALPNGGKIKLFKVSFK